MLVGTPIGNLADLSPRAIEALAGADIVCCEDTRRTGRLLVHAGVSGATLRVVNEHTEAAMVDEVVAWVGAGKRVALVSDAGMPAVSDPGARLVAAVADADLAVEVVPGPSAALAALVVSGLPTGRFTFEGFLARSGAGRSARIAAVAAEERTTVLFEAPHRLAKTLSALAEACGGERGVVLARELTKLHEEVWRGTLAEASDRAEASEPRGEHVIVLAGAPPPAEADDEAVLAALAAARSAGSSTRDAVAQVAAELGVARRRVYDLAVRQARTG